MFLYLMENFSKKGNRKRLNMKFLDFLRPLGIKGKIRLGNRHDGGYVVYEKALRETDVLVTYGVGWNVAFEEEFNKITGKKVLMFDPTMVGKYLVDIAKLRKDLLNLRFGALVRYLCSKWVIWKKYKELESNGVLFVNEGIAASKSKKYDTLFNHMDRYDLQGKNLLIKMDIEGAEYKIFADRSIYSCLQNANQLIIEVHDLKNRLTDLKTIVEELDKFMVLVHIHANNYGETFKLFAGSESGGGDITLPDVLEMLFVKRKIILREDILDVPESYPVADLDAPNNPKRNDLPLGFV
jgi:hypothetical protein